MFILNLTYVKSIEAVESELNAHIGFLDKYYSSGNFICSGRKNPRTGGIILCNAKNKEEVEEIIKEDPFYIKQVAEYEIIEFSPTKYVDGFESFLLK
ncbi:MAG: YciI family protein [Bacillota bacterium]|nr:YciI family protein [Bacillota bacterium]